MSQNKNVKYPFHAVHNAFDSGLVLLYAMEAAPDILHQTYGAKRVLDVVNQISALFLVASKTWPDAMLVGDRYDELQKAVTKCFIQGRDKDTASDSARLDCLRDMLFRVDHDATFSNPGNQPVLPHSDGSNQWPQLLATPPDSQQLLTLDPTLDIDMELLVSNMLDGSWEDSVLEWPGFPSDGAAGPLTSVLDPSRVFDPHWLGFPPDVPALPTPPVVSPSTPDRAAVDTAIELLPACRQCRQRRVRCDRGFPSCQTCLSSQKECMHKDPVSGEMTSRKHIAALRRTFTTLMDEWESTSSARRPMKTVNSITSPAEYGTLQFFGPSTAMVEIPATSTTDTSSPVHLDAESWFLSPGCNTDMPPPHVRNEILQEMKPLNIIYPVFHESDEFLHLFTQKPDLQSTPESLLIIAICLQLRSRTDQRYKSSATGYFNGAIRTHLSLDPMPPMRQTQLLTLECIFILLCPPSGDIWRMVGAAVRACVELCEEHHPPSPSSQQLLRTVFCLEISICVTLARPPQSPCLYDSLNLDMSPSCPTGSFQFAFCSLSWLQALDLIDELAGTPAPGRLDTFSPGAYDDATLHQFSQYIHARALRSTPALAQALSGEMVRTRFPFSWIDAHEVGGAMVRSSQSIPHECACVLREMAADPDFACRDLFDMVASSG